MSKFLEKINPLNWVEKFIIKRMVKKLTKVFPKLKEKGEKVVKENIEELKINVETKIMEYIESKRK